MQATDLAGVTRRSDADIRLAETVDDPALRSFFLQSLDLKSDPPKWRLNLEVLGQSMAEIMGFPEVDGTFDSPTLMLSGADSDYVSRRPPPPHQDPVSKREVCEDTRSGALASCREAAGIRGGHCGISGRLKTANLKRCVARAELMLVGSEIAALYYPHRCINRRSPWFVSSRLLPHCFALAACEETAKGIERDLQEGRPCY